MIKLGKHTRKLSTKRIREDIENDDLLKALLQSIADLELLFFWKLMYEKGIKASLMNKWTLGRYLIWASGMKLTDQEQIELLKDFNETRNMFVHGRYFMNRIGDYPHKKQYLSNMILHVCDFLDSQSVTFQHDPEIEKEYNEHSDKMERKYNRFVEMANR